MSAEFTDSVQWVETVFAEAPLSCVLVALAFLIALFLIVSLAEKINRNP
jgi:flagellar biogenesis protein FliO